MKNNKNIFQNMKTNFFGKVLSNIDLGIEFSTTQIHEIIQTNFNSIVNSHIQLNKILIELTIPNTFINNNKLYISNFFCWKKRRLKFNFNKKNRNKFSKKRR